MHFITVILTSVEVDDFILGNKSFEPKSSGRDSTVWVPSLRFSGSLKNLELKKLGSNFDGSWGDRLIIASNGK